VQVFFAGAEVASHLAVLRSCGVQRIAVSVANLARNSPGKLDQWPKRERLEGLEWVLYGDSQHSPVEPAMEILSGAEVAPEAVIGPVEWFDQTWLRDSDLLFLPTWDGSDPTKLREYTESFDGLALPDAVVDNPTAVRTAKAALSRLGMLGAITGRTKGLERFDMLLSGAWWNVQKYGETQVWASNRLIRLNADDKAAKRERYAPAMEELGCDVAKILSDDTSESLRCAVLSWLALERHIERGHAPRSQSEVTETHPSHIPSNVVPIGPGVTNVPAVPRHQLLPVMDLSAQSMTVRDAEGNEVEEVHHTIQVKPESMRQCNSCSIALGCPGYTPNSACAYNIPVILRTKGQLLGVLRSVTEIQTQRILMARFSEEINGQHDPEVGKEMDRLFTMVEKWKEIEDNRDHVKLSIDAKGDAGNLGVLSRLFGQTAGRNATMLDEPVTSTEIIEEMTEDD
jgi:hypothetical protein